MKQFVGVLLLTLPIAAGAAAAPTFNKDIAPILYSNCATCHRPGEVRRFPCSLIKTPPNGLL